MRPPRLGETSSATITAAMDARGACLAPAMAASIADLPATSVLDVAGGSGIYAYALLETILEDVGFCDVEERPAGPDRSVVLARKPS